MGAGVAGVGGAGVQAGPVELASVSALLRQSLWLDPLTQREVERQIWGDPDFDPDLLVWVPDAAREGMNPLRSLRGVAFGVIRPERERSVGYIKVIAVHPRWQRQGIGEQLLTELEQRLQSRGVQEIRVSGSAPCYLWAGVDVRYTAAFCLFQKKGYSRYSDAINMTVELATAPLDTGEDEVRLRQNGVSVARLRPEEMDEVGSWVEQRFGANWRWEVAATLQNEPVSCFIARRSDGQVAGFAACAGNRRQWFGPMGTEPDQRHLGIGRMLLRLCLRDLREKGYTEAQISWTGPVSFYARCVEARMERSFWLMRKELATVAQPESGAS